MIVTPSPLSGQITAPPSKSAAHRALIAAMLADGDSRLFNVEHSQDIDVTLSAIQTLGARVREETDAGGRLRLTITGGRPRPAEAVIRCGESGSALRFLVPVALALGGETTFEGTGRLPRRPMEPYFALFDRHGVGYRRPAEASLPLAVEGPLRPGQFALPGGVSSQFVTGLMLALPILPGESVIKITGPLESGGYVELTRAVLSEFGVRIEADGPDRYRVPGGQRYAPAAYAVEGDWSQAAFFLTAGALGGDVRVDGLRMDCAQGDRVIVDILRSMGGDVRTGDGWARARRSALRGRDVDVSQCPDLAPAVAAALALAEGEGRVTGAGRLRLKESDRIASITETLGRLGANIRDEGDVIWVRGAPSLRGGAADSCGDHRIAMMAACVSGRCENAVNLTGAEAVNKSYPGFWDDLVRLGGALG